MTTDRMPGGVENHLIVAGNDAGVELLRFSAKSIEGRLSRVLIVGCSARARSARDPIDEVLTEIGCVGGEDPGARLGQIHPE